mgnify:CR=1 FL=1
MGFFADILRDSRRGGTAARVSAAAPAAGSGSGTTGVRLREESGGQPMYAGQTPVQDGSSARRVLDPVPTEQTLIAGRHGMTTEGADLHDPGTGEQGDCGSARAVISDSFMGESSPGEALSRIGERFEEPRVEGHTAEQTGGPAEEDEEASGLPAVSMESDTAEIRLREEGGGPPVNAGSGTLQDGGAVTRRVVGPSLSEYTPGSGIPEVTMKGVSLPNPAARKQAGRESARTESDRFRVESMKSFHDGDSIDAPLVPVDARDSSVRESSSGDAASRTGKVSAETQGRRQAGLNRAGTITPSDQSAETMKENHGMEQAAGLQGKTFPSAAGEVPADTVQEELHHGGMPAAAPSSTPDSKSVERFQRPSVRPLPPIPKDSEEKGSGRSLPPPEPQVRIGAIEVVVVVPAPADRLPRSGERSRPDLASRHYLRNF